MLSSNVEIGARVKYKFSDHTGIIVGNKSRQGDQVVYVELDNEYYDVEPMNINDLLIQK